MTESHTISGLKAKYLEIISKIEYHKKELILLYKQANTIASSIAIFDESCSINELKPINFKQRYFKKGELSAYILNLIKSNQKISINDIIKSVIDYKNLDIDYQINIKITLKNLENKKLITKSIYHNNYFYEIA